MLGKGLQLKTTGRFVILLSVVREVFEKLVNNRIVDNLEKCGFFSGFQYGFRSPKSTADLLTVVSDRIGRAFNMSFNIKNMSKVFIFYNQEFIFPEQEVQYNDFIIKVNHLQVIA